MPRIHGTIRLLALAVAAALLVTSAAPDAEARRKKKKEVVTATVNGKQRRWRAKKVTVLVTNDTVTIIATILRPHRLNQFIPGLSIFCALDRTVVFPVTPVFPQLCVMGYSETHFSRHPENKMWGGSNGLGNATVTFDSLVGTRLQGHFSGMLTPEGGNTDPSVSVQNGTFSVDVGG